MLNNLKSYNDNKIIESVIKVIIVVLMLYGAYLIIEPFIAIFIWSVIIAVTLDPLVTKCEQKFKIPRNYLSFLLAFAIIFLMLAPIVGLAISLNDTMQDLLLRLHNGTFNIPMPGQKVKDLPLVGNSIYDLWNQLSTNFNGLLIERKDDVLHYSKITFLTIGNTLFAVVSFMVSVVLASILISKNITSIEFMNQIAVRLAGEHSIEILKISTQTIRSVMQGVIGIALIQAACGYIGFNLIEIPFPVVWALVLLVLAIVQLPAIIVMAPAILYVFSTSDTVPAVIFAIYSAAVGLMDNVLKPLMLGRGVDVPMVVILIGAIGGMLVWGILGLFIGSVLLAVLYQLFIAWLKHEAQSSQKPSNE